MYMYVISAATSFGCGGGRGDGGGVDQHQRVFVDQSPHIRNEELFGLRLLNVAKLEVWKRLCV